MVTVETQKIADIKVLRPKRFKDRRGSFLETYNRSEYSKAGISCEFVQDNQSLSLHKGTIRGMHFQMPPFAQAKLVRVVTGAILDVAVDLRSNSSTFRQWCCVEINATENNQIFIPRGFAHGFVTLEANTIVQYKVDNYYSPHHERGFHWNDRNANINWNISKHDVVISDKDDKLPGLKDLPVYF